MAEIDTSGLPCPLPVLRARRALEKMAPGEELLVCATDPAAVRDFPAFCRANGHELIHAEEHDGVYEFLIANKS